jgi:hypothetical protein
MYCPFKSSFDEYKAHWNFIQSSTCMYVQCAFGILKDRWRIFQKWADVPLKSVANIVSTFIVLHNLCIIIEDKFDPIWIKELESRLKKRIDDGTVKGVQVLQREQASIDEIKAQTLKSDVRRTI